jgi:hypothetical protein
MSPSGQQEARIIMLLQQSSKKKSGIDHSQSSSFKASQTEAYLLVTFR